MSMMPSALLTKKVFGCWDYVDVDCANLRYELAQLELNQTLQWKHMARRSARKARLLFQDDVVQNFVQTLYE